MPYTPGPFNGPHQYLQWGGTLPGGDEWSCGLRLAPIAGVTPINDPTMLNGVAAAVEAFHSNSSAEISPRALLTFTKLNVIGVDGRYANPTTLEHIHANVPGTGLDSRTQPNQITLAISLVTAVSRGPAHRGRFYMPLPAIIPGTDGRIGADHRDAVQTAATSFLTALNAVTSNYKVSVMSRKLGAPASRTVTGIQVGRVLDTQRRRRNKLVEAY